MLVASGRSTKVMLLVLAVAGAYWLWFGLTQRSIFQDEGISLLAAQGIVDNGYPRLPSGFLYVRGYLPHYLLAGAIYIFGANQLSIMLPSLIMGLGSLWLVYMYARDVIGKPWVGVATIVILMALQMQALYATSPRMYMTLQFFTMLAAYSAWRGYVQGDRKFKWVTFIAIMAVMLSHQQGIALLVAIPLAALAVTWIKGRRITALQPLVAAVSLLPLAATATVLTLYRPGEAPVITAYTFGANGPLGLNLNPLDWAKGSLTLRDLFLFGFGFMPLVLFLAASIIRRRWRDTHPGVIYALLIVTSSAAITVVGTTQAYARMWFFILPLYVFLVCAGIAMLVERFGPKVRDWLAQNPVNRAAALLLLIIAALITLGVSSFTLGMGFSDTVGKVVGPPCRKTDCDKTIKVHYAHLRQHVESGDLMISSNPFVTHYYLGKVDGYLREKTILGRDGTESTFEQLTDEYFGIPLVNADDLQELFSGESGERRVWVITDQRTAWISSAETQDFLESFYALYRDDELVTTYVKAGITN